MYHRQGEQDASFITNCQRQAVICKFIQSGAAPLLISIKKLANDSLSLAFVLKLAFRSASGWKTCT
jgi:hypothetical protein